MKLFCTRNYILYKLLRNGNLHESKEFKSCLHIKHSKFIATFISVSAMTFQYLKSICRQHLSIHQFISQKYTYIFRIKWGATKIYCLRCIELLYSIYVLKRHITFRAKYIYFFFNGFISQIKNNMLKID